jgi:hypothetical protein
MSPAPCDLDDARDARITARLVALPDTPLDPRFAAEVLRSAREILVEAREGSAMARASRLWYGTLLPAALVACAIVYACDAVRTIERIYVASAH